MTHECKPLDLYADALVMCVYDMGNGVDRVERAQLVPVRDVLERMAEGIAMPLPFPARYHDIIEQVTLAMDGTLPAADVVVGTFIRAVDDRTVEIYRLRMD